MRRLATAFFLLLAAPAFGGGFSTTGLSSLPDGTAPGEPWTVDVRVMAHGVSPAAGLRPNVVISRGGDLQRFRAREIKPGVYRARVVFPDAGRWSYGVEAYGGGYLETFGAVRIADADRTAVAPAASSDDGGPPWLAAILAGLAAAGLTVLVTRRRPPRRVPVPAP